MLQKNFSVPLRDLEEIANGVTNLLPALIGRRILLTGGTGFFGKWILETISFLNVRQNLRSSVTAITRSPEAFLRRNRDFATESWISFVKGDVTLREIESDGPFDYCIHAASPVNDTGDPKGVFESITRGTENTLRTAALSGVGRCLYVSSGAVYGANRGPACIAEDIGSAPEMSNPSSAYGEGKRVGELMCSFWQKNSQMKCTIARCFAFLGPHLPLNGRFAAGNFIRDGLTTRKIIVNSDGTAVRSYMYPTDLITWLLTILIKGKPLHAYNVGSNSPMTIDALAHRIAQHTGASVKIMSTSNEFSVNIDNYVPCVQRANSELGLRETILGEECISRTIDWFRNRQESGFSLTEN